MKITGTVVRLGIFSLVLLLFTVMIFIVFGQIRFDSTHSYSAEFTNVSGLREGQFVRASGVEIGKVKSIELVDGGKRARVKFNVDRSVPLYQSTTAQIRYLDLVGNRYMELSRGEGEGAERVLPPGGFIPLARTSPRPSSPCFRVRAAPSTTSSTRQRKRPPVSPSVTKRSATLSKI